jgi:hypothetical protein
MITYTETYADRCEACGIETTRTFRLDGDANAADACYFCAEDFALRFVTAQLLPIPAEAWTMDGADVLTFVKEWTKDVDGYLASVFLPRVSASALAEASAIIEGSRK